MKKPWLVAIDMGYGHLRPAFSLAEVLGCQVYEADKPPLAQAEEMRLWAATRHAYELISRASQLPMLGGPLRTVLEGLTSIPHLHPYRDLSQATGPVRMLKRLCHKGLGRGLADKLKKSQAPLLTTFYAPALLSDHLGCEDVYCVVTDSDINRVWAPIDPQDSTAHYLVPTDRTRRRLRVYGVRRDRITTTGFPLPHSLLGGPQLTSLKNNLRGRLVRLDPRKRFREQSQDELKHFLGELPEDQEQQPVHLVFAIGGAGAQTGLVKRFLPSLAPLIRQDKLRLTLVAGIRLEVCVELNRTIQAAGLGRESVDGRIQVLYRADIFEYFRSFNELLATADILWTKPSEMTFYAALGLPLILSWPVGVHERYNRRWAIENGAALKQRDPRFIGDWLRELLKDGTLAAAAWCGYTRLPKHGLYRIVERVMGAEALPVLLNNAGGEARRSGVRVV